MPYKRVVREEAQRKIDEIDDAMEVMRKLGKRYQTMRAKKFKDALAAFVEQGVDEADAKEILIRQGLFLPLNL